jgi:hypothetical protein
MIRNRWVVKKPRFGTRAAGGWYVKRIVILLAGIVSILIAREAQTQKPTPDQLAQYHLIQVADPNTFVEKINEAAGKGYRLMAMSHASAQGLSAIMERVEKASESYNYLSIPVQGFKGKYATPGKVKAEVAEQLNAAGAKGYHLRMTFGASGEGIPDVAMMESNSGPQQLYEYALVSPGLFGYYSNSQLSRLITDGYRWTGTAGGPLLILEKVTDSSRSQGSPQGQRVAAAHQRFEFPENNVIRSHLPEKELRKLAAEGARVIDFFGSPMQMVLAMESTMPPSAPYEYVVLKDQNLASPLALHVKMSEVEAADLTRVGQQGFRMLRLSATAPPFVMEKAPGNIRHYEYQFVSSPRLAKLAEQLNSSSLAGFQVARMQSLGDGFLVIMEKTIGAQP